jgi:hypothetical protein
MMLTPMTNMLELMLGSPMGMISDLGKLSGADVSWMELRGGEPMPTQC